jgi:uncharacterized protein
MILPFLPAAVRRSLLTCLLMAGFSAALPARAITVEQIPRPAGWAVDLTGTLSAATLADLNRLGDDVKAKTGAELAVVVISTTGGVKPRQFATRLLNHWGIGAPGQNNGLLVFAALDDRTVEIILGDDLDDDARVRASEEIVQEVMVPRFREGDPAGAVLQGAVACASRILGASPVPAEVLVSPKASPSSSRRSRALLVPLGFGFLLLLLAGGAALAGGIWLLVRPHLCPKCRTKMVLLSEAQDDAHLQPSERTEERIGSVNYNIWHCPGCGEIRKTRWGRFFSGYSTCLSCSARTSISLYTTVLPATRNTTGLIRVDKRCAHCFHSRSYTYATPCLETSDAYLISSDSGSSSDGGHSSGHGASGHW